MVPQFPSEVGPVGHFEEEIKSGVSSECSLTGENSTWPMKVTSANWVNEETNIPRVIGYVS